MQSRTLIGKTVALTGASGGLGRALCEKILADGGALIVIDRNEKKQTALIDSLRSAYPEAKIEGLIADMVNFFDTGDVSFDVNETKEVIKLVEMVLKARDNPGVVIEA